MQVSITLNTQNQIPLRKLLFLIINSTVLEPSYEDNVIYLFI